MPPPMLLGRAHPEKRAYFYIVVKTMYVGETVVHDIVFQLPHKIVGTQKAECVARHHIQFFGLRKTAMTGSFS